MIGKSFKELKTIVKGLRNVRAVKSKKGKAYIQIGKKKYTSEDLLVKLYEKIITNVEKHLKLCI